MDTPSYYVIIPASIRYDPRVPASAKLLYGEVTALSQEKGVCWASNRYFTKIYGVSARTLQTWIKSLVDNGYIQVAITEKGRKMWITSAVAEVASGEDTAQNSAGGADNFAPQAQINAGSCEKNCAHNNTRYNTRSNNIPKPTFEEVVEYCKQRNNMVDPQRFWDHYESIGWHIGKSPMKDWQAAVRVWERNTYRHASPPKYCSEPADNDWPF